jgi:O-acetylhomoserine (thiol)-lyase
MFSMTQPVKRSFGFETRMLHAGQIPDAETGSRAVPIFQTSSYVFKDADQAAQLFDLKQYGNIYTRLSNPTTAVLEERVASLENATGSVAVASGMAAQFSTIMTLCSPGDSIVASTDLYGGTITQLTHTLKKLSVDVQWVSPNDLAAWEQAVTPKTRALYGEIIGNPGGSILDLEPLAALAKGKKIPLIVDSTFATPALCRPIDWGASIVTHSATKFLGGHGNSLGGLVVDSGNFDFSTNPNVADPTPAYHDLKFFETFGHYGFLMKLRCVTVRDTGGCISPMNSFLLLQGVETLTMRMERHTQNALGVAKFLAAHPAVEVVHYAGLPNHPHHALAKKYLPQGPGAVFAFEIKDQGNGAREAGKKFIESLQLFSHLANIGDAKSLVIHPGSTTHQQLSDEELKRSGIGPGTIRLSVGLETLEDLLWDLDQALHATSI